MFIFVEIVQIGSVFTKHEWLQAKTLFFFLFCAFCLVGVCFSHAIYCQINKERVKSTHVLDLTWKTQITLFKDKLAIFKRSRSHKTKAIYGSYKTSTSKFRKIRS